MKVVMLVAVLALARVGSAQNADDYRGGWRTDKGKAPTYELSIRGNRGRGIYCTDCAAAPTLAFVDGTLGPGGGKFEPTRIKDCGGPEPLPVIGAILPT